MVRLCYLNVNSAYTKSESERQLILMCHAKSVSQQSFLIIRLNASFLLSILSRMPADIAPALVLTRNGTTKVNTAKPAFPRR